MSRIDLFGITLKSMEIIFQAGGNVLRMVI